MASIIYIVGKIIKSTRQGYLDVLSYVFITALYGIFFTYFFNDLFITNEDYTFRFIANCFTNFYLLVALFGYWIITRTNAKKTIFALLLTVLIMNLMLALGSIVTIDESNDSPEIDPFIAEINRSIEDIKDAPGLPYTRIITYESNKGKFDSVTFINIGHDTLFKYDEVGIKVFKEMALANIKKIDSASTKMQFKKTKDMFRYLREYHFLYATMFDYPPCDSCFVSGLRVMDKDSTLVKISKTYIIDSVYLRNRV
ncbi:hypothetical protein IM792_06070 [Mucilaginibacter sp. JRF]|uniref:hypothetical protein n=1 Tax=Mucilaginibacter sp. JRF TaxID=2780088 RepID=UPI00187F483B|nr:hypothetical protein [Mucilaginibacter sp. JRF]MBE9584009.1 hypothetical protein [Mucilaginibacter sp. JRF]